MSISSLETILLVLLSDVYTYSFHIDDDPEMNLAENAEAMKAGNHDGWEPTSWDGIHQTMEVLAHKNIKVIINGGALNPGGLARKTQQLVRPAWF